ncbi:MAG: SO_0444 family Cu/Zn efflux transporter [Pseudomonadota bacterium]
MLQWLGELLYLTLEAAPWLLLGLVIAAVIKAFSDRLAIARYLSGESTPAIVRAALIGAPLPLCSCGVVPAVLGLREAGAGRGPSLSFLVATPETGPDSISVSYGLLGPVYAIVRPIAAVLGAIVTGLVAGRVGTPVPEGTSETSASCSGDSCCGETTEAEESGGDCCGSEKPAQQQDSALARLGRGMDYAFGQVLLDIMPWMVFGLAVAATAVVLIPDGFFDSPWGIVGSYLLMAVIGVPMYVCATASTPIAAGLLVAGMSPGAALVFLLAGPATNIGTLGILRKHFGTRTIAAYLAAVIGSALLAGIVLDLLWTRFDWALPQAAPAGHEITIGWLGGLSVLLLAVATARAWAKRRTARRNTEDSACGCSGNAH